VTREEWIALWDKVAGDYQDSDPYEGNLLCALALAWFAARGEKARPADDWDDAIERNGALIPRLPVNDEQDPVLLVIDAHGHTLDSVRQSRCKMSGAQCQ
jgi:hypothetical protein